MPPGDDGAGEVEEREVVGGLLGPTDQDAAEAVEPGVCSLDYPAARFGAGMTFGMGFLATGAQMQGEAEGRGQGTRFIIVEALVEAEVLWPAAGRLGPLDRDCLDSLAHQLMVVAVGPVDHRPEGDTAAIGEDRALDPTLALIRRIWASFLPSQRRLAHRPVQRQPVPIDALYSIIGKQAVAPEGREHPGGNPFLETPLGRGGGADRRLSQRVPLAAGAQHEEDRVHRRPVRHARIVAPQRMLWPRRQQPLHLGPQRIRQTPAIISDTPFRRPPNNTLQHHPEMGLSRHRTYWDRHLA